MILLICLMDLILFLIFKIILNTSLKKDETIADNPPVQIYVDKIKNRIVFKVKTGFKLELLTKKNNAIIRKFKKDIDKNKGGGVLPRLKTAELL